MLQVNKMLPLLIESYNLMKSNTGDDKAAAGTDEHATGPRCGTERTWTWRKIIRCLSRRNCDDMTCNEHMDLGVLED